jgi:hypothetical protein
MLRPRKSCPLNDPAAFFTSFDIVNDNRQSDPNGCGVVAKRDLEKGEEFIDPSVQYSASSERHSTDDGFIKYADGGFTVRDRVSGFCGFSFFINEARGDHSPNIRWKPIRVESGDRSGMINGTVCFGWKVLRPIKQNEEILAKYLPASLEAQQAKEEEDAREQAVEMKTKESSGETRTETVPPKEHARQRTRKRPRAQPQKEAQRVRHQQKRIGSKVLARPGRRPSTALVLVSPQPSSALVQSSRCRRQQALPSFAIGQQVLYYPRRYTSASCCPPQGVVAATGQRIRLNGRIISYHQDLRTYTVATDPLLDAETNAMLVAAETHSLVPPARLEAARLEAARHAGHAAVIKDCAAVVNMAVKTNAAVAGAGERAAAAAAALKRELKQDLKQDRGERPAKIKVERRGGNEVISEGVVGKGVGNKCGAQNSAAGTGEVGGTTTRHRKVTPRLFDQPSAQQHDMCSSGTALTQLVPPQPMLRQVLHEPQHQLAHGLTCEGQLDSGQQEQQEQEELSEGGQELEEEHPQPRQPKKTKVAREKQVPRQPARQAQEALWEVERIVNHRHGFTHFEVKWVNYPTEENTWNKKSESLRVWPWPACLCLCFLLCAFKRAKLTSAGAWIVAGTLHGCKEAIGHYLHSIGQGRAAAVEICSGL